MEGTFASLLPTDMLSQALCFPSPATEHRPWLAGQPQPRTAKAWLKGGAPRLPVFRAAFTDIRGRLSTLRVKGRVRDSRQHALSSEISLTHVSVFACAFSLGAVSNSSRRGCGGAMMGHLQTG